MERDGDYVLFERDPVMMREIWLADRGEHLEVQVRYFVDALLDANQAIEKESHGRAFGDWVHIASVPHGIVNQTSLDRALKNGDKKYVSRWFNDADNQKFRTSRGKF